MSEYIIHVEDAKTLYGNADFPFSLDAYLREEIVRCRDCRHYEYWEFRDGRTAHDCARGGDYLFDTEPDGFCAWGERNEKGLKKIVDKSIFDRREYYSRMTKEFDSMLGVRK